MIETITKQLSHWQTFSSDKPDEIALQRCIELGLDPQKKISEWTEDETNRLLNYLRAHRIPFNTMIILNPITIRGILKIFQCKRCGKCCLEIGEIPLAPYEPKRIANHLGVSTKSIKRLTQINDEGRYLNTPCPFYNGLCSIQAVKPLCCIQFPIADPIIFDGIPLIQLNTFCDQSIKLCRQIIHDRKILGL